MGINTMQAAEMCVLVSIPAQFPSSNPSRHNHSTLTLSTSNYTAIMIYFPQLVVVLTAIHSAIAVPTGQTQASVQKRGPHNFVMGPDHPLMMARRNESLFRRATNYIQDYTTGGTVDFSPESGEFSVSWDTTDDFVVGVGWNPGSTE